MHRNPTLSDQTNADFYFDLSPSSRELARLADPLAERRYAVLVDGVPLGRRKNELRSPRSTFYEQSFYEANSAAHLAVSLDLDLKGTIEVRRRQEPFPDIELLIDGSTFAFVEQTMVMDQQAHIISRDLDTLNAQIDQCEESCVRARLADGALTIRLNELPPRYYNERIPVEGLVAEALAFIRTLSDNAVAVKLEIPQFPLFNLMNGHARYVPGRKWDSQTVSLAEHGRLQMLLPALADQIRKKRATVSGYPQSCRPLWLTLDLCMHFGCNIDTDPMLEVVAHENPFEYDRVIVQQARRAPLILSPTLFNTKAR